MRSNSGEFRYLEIREFKIPCVQVEKKKCYRARRKFKTKKTKGGRKRRKKSRRKTRRKRKTNKKKSKKGGMMGQLLSTAAVPFTLLGAQNMFGKKSKKSKKSRK